MGSTPLWNRIQISKAVTYDERPKIKRDARLKAVFSPRKFVVRYSFKSRYMFAFLAGDWGFDVFIIVSSAHKRFGDFKKEQPIFLNKHSLRRTFLFRVLIHQKQDQIRLHCRGRGWGWGRCCKPPGLCKRKSRLHSTHSTGERALYVLLCVWAVQAGTPTVAEPNLNLKCSCLFSKGWWCSWRKSTDKETDESWDIFIHNMKNQFWAGLGSQAVLWATFEACFHGQKINLIFFLKIL